MKLKKLQDKFILVSDEQPTDYYLDDTNTIRKVVTDDEEYWSVRKDYKKIISETPDFSLLKEEDCKEIGWVDVEKLAIESVEYDTFPNIAERQKHINRFIEGFEVAQTLNDEKLIGNEQGSLDNFLLNSVLYTQEERELIMDAISNWLQKTEWDVEVEMEDVFIKNEENYVHHTGAKGNYSTHNKQPKITNNSIKVLRIL